MTFKTKASEQKFVTNNEKLKILKVKNIYADKYSISNQFSKNKQLGYLIKI